ncbi:MAG: hypothetical protein Q9221_008071 [Calogaya cf. arnoldii]
MKFVNILSPLVVVFGTMSSCITATAVTGAATEWLAKPDLAKRAAAPVTLRDIQNFATDVFAIQTVGSKSRQDQLDQLCFRFDPTLLAYQGYNFPLMHKIFCNAAWALYICGDNTDECLSSRLTVQTLTMTYASYLWSFQAVGALTNTFNNTGALKALCENIDTIDALQVGLDGVLVQNTLCNVAKGGSLPKPLELPVPFEDVRKMRLGNSTKGVEIYGKDVGFVRRGQHGL